MMFKRLNPVKNKGGTHSKYLLYSRHWHETHWYETHWYETHFYLEDIFSWR